MAGCNTANMSMDVNIRHIFLLILAIPPPSFLPQRPFQPATIYYHWLFQFCNSSLYIRYRPNIHVLSNLQNQKQIPKFKSPDFDKNDIFYSLNCNLIANYVVSFPNKLNN